MTAQLWYTRCPVPTASGLAYSLGWIGSRYAETGIEIGILQDAPLEIARHHYDHRLVGLVREGGNVPAFAAKAEGAPTRLVGLTWIEERQAIVVRPDSGITSAAHLAGVRVAVPAFADTRDTSMGRAMAVQGFRGALSIADLTLDDVQWIEVHNSGTGNVAPPLTGNLNNGRDFWSFDDLLRGDVDAIYVKGPGAAELTEQLGLVVAVDLDAHPDRSVRVNNGTPRPITVHEELLRERPELVVAFLAETLRAAEWAAANPAGVRATIARETGSGALGVDIAFRTGFNESLHPDLSAERLELFRQQKDELLRHGFLVADVDIDAWAAPEYLELAQQELAARVVA